MIRIVGKFNRIIARARLDCSSVFDDGDAIVAAVRIDVKTVIKVRALTCINCLRVVVADDRRGKRVKQISKLVSFI